MATAADGKEELVKEDVGEETDTGTLDEVVIGANAIALAVAEEAQKIGVLLSRAC